MLRRWHVLLLILVTLAAFCGLAAAKLRATPKFDRVQAGMSVDEVEEVLGRAPPFTSSSWDAGTGDWFCDEGEIQVLFAYDEERFAGGEVDGPGYITWSVTEKRITRRGPLERLAWLAGWR